MTGAKARSKPAASKAVAVNREPSSADVAAIERAKENYRARPLRVELKVDHQPGVMTRIEADHRDAQGGSYQVQDAFGSSSAAFVTRGLTDLGNVAGLDSDSLSAALALVAAVEPQSELESALAQQMAATHTLTMQMYSRLKRADRLDTLTAYGNLATKLSRTFTAQVEALTKLRTGGKQVVEHRYIYVGEGGQAIVAEQFNNLHGGVGNPFIDGQPHARGSALPGTDEVAHGVPVTSDAERPLPDARRDVARSAEGEPKRVEART